MRYVIIGGSAAAIGCIEGIRSVDKTGEIILITRETEWNYSSYEENRTYRNS